MQNVVTLNKHAYLDKKAFTLAELQAASGSRIFIKRGHLNLADGRKKLSLLWREVVNIHGQSAHEVITEKRVNHYAAPDKLNDKFTFGKNKGFFTPFGFTLADLPTLTDIVVCAGMADGYRLHQTLAMPVAAGIGENNIPFLVEEIQRVNPNITITVAGDNDHAGIMAVHKTLCRFILPDTQKDWSDIYQNEGVEALSKQANNVRSPLSLFPDNQYPHQLELVQLHNDINKEINRITRSESQANAAARIKSILIKYQFRMPFEVDIEQLQKQLIIAGKYTINAENVKTLINIIKTRIDQRQRVSESHTSFKHFNVKKKHDLQLLPGLPKFSEILSDFSGVMLIRAPKGIGKTEFIGAPFVAAYQDKGYTMASCHSAPLTDDLKERLKLDGYRDPHLRPAETTGLAICVASIAKEKFSPFIDNVEYLFIDEIKQTLNFLQAKECATKGKTNADVYNKFKQIVANAKCIVGVDADINQKVIDFIELCRPGERFKIYDIEDSKKFERHAPKDFKPVNTHKIAKKQIDYIVGDNAESRGYGDILARVKEGENLWITVESSDRVNVLAKFIETQIPGTKVMAINASNKGNKAQSEFLANVNREAPNYQVVIHSPVIRSGVSVVAPKGKEHFNHTYFIGSGHCIVPSDASQMLARVRYVHNYTVLLLANNASPHTRDHRAILLGKEQASLQDGSHLEATEFDEFCAKVTEDENNAKADFISGFLWLLKREGHKVKANKGSDIDYIHEIKASKFETEQEWREWVSNAGNINSDQYFELSAKNNKSLTEVCQLEKYRMCGQLNVDKLTDYDFDIWNDGRIMAEAKRFSACFEQMAFKEKSDVKHLTHRQFSKAKVWAYQYLFEGIDFETGRISQEQAQQIVLRAIKKRYMLAELGILPAKYAKYYQLRKDGSDPFPLPKTPMKDVQSIFKKMGLSLNRKDNYHQEDKSRQNDYQLNVEKYAEMRDLTVQIDFSRLGGYLLKDKAVNAEIEAEKLQLVKDIVVGMLNLGGQQVTARIFLDNEAEKLEKLGITRKDKRVLELYQLVKRAS